MRAKGLMLLVILVLLTATLVNCGEPEPTPTPAPTPTPTPAPLVRDLAAYLPADAAMFVAMQLHPQGAAADNWQRIRDAFSSIPSVRQGLDEMAAELQQDMPFSWQTDVEPWLGDAMVMAFTDLSFFWEEMGSLPQAGGDFELEEPKASDVPMLIAVEVSDVQGYTSFQENVRAAMAADGLTVAENVVAGTTVYSASDEEMTVAFALHNERTLLLSSNPTLLEEALQRSSGDSLASSQNFLSLLEQLPGGAMMVGYVDMAGFMEGMSGAYSALGMALPQGLTGMAGEVAFALVAESDGLRFESTTRIDWAAMAEAGLREYYERMREPLPARSLNLIPQDAAFVLASFSPGGLQAAWDQQMATMQQMSPEAYDQIQWELSDLAAEIGLNIEEDVLSWMTGEYAIFLAPPEQPGATTAAGIPSFRAGIVIEVGDRTQAEATMGQLESLLLQQGLPFYDQEINGVAVRVASDLAMMGYLPGYAFVDDMLLIAIDESSFRTAFEANRNEGARLTAGAGFRTMGEYLPRPSTSLFFLDIVGITNFLDNVLEEPELTQFRQEVRPVLDLLGGLGMAQQVGEDYSRSTVFLHMPR